jgi:hypothetical protein
MPTAIPDEPFASRFGKRDGSTDGSIIPPSKFGTKSTVSRSMSRSTSSARPREPGLGVAVGGGRIAVDRSEVALAVDERIAEREVLGHPHHRVVDRAVAVRVIVLEHLADHAGRLLEAARREQALLLHRVEDPPVDRLQAVAHVGQRAADDHRHRVVEERAPDLVLDVHGRRAPSGGACAAGGGSGGWGGSVISTPSAILDVQVLHVERVALDEQPPRLDVVAHQRAERVLGLDLVGHAHLEQRARSRIIVVSASWSGFISPRPL